MNNLNEYAHVCLLLSSTPVLQFSVIHCLDGEWVKRQHNDGF